MKEVESNDQKLLKKASLNIKLVPENEKDIRMAKLLKLQSVESSEEIKLRKRREILTQSVFPKSSALGKKKVSLTRKPQLDQLVKSLSSGSSKSRTNSIGKQSKDLLSGLRIKIKK